MTEPAAKIRLHVDAPLSEGAEIALPRDQAHYLISVMRRGPGDAVLLFNGRDGEWRAEISAASRRDATLAARARTRPQSGAPDLDLLFAPVKKTRTDFIVEKATELGVRRLRPVFTERANASRVNTERLRALAREAAEQCGRLSIPEIDEAAPLRATLASWDAARRLMICDETGAAPPAAAALASLAAAEAARDAPWAILIGPEGGFAPEELKRLRAAPFAEPVSLGPRILRADTAAAAAVTIWQTVLGDWA